MRELKYQDQANADIFAAWARGVSRILLVSPTGGGKTHICARAIQPPDRVLWLEHRSDLVDQMAVRLEQTFGYANVGRIQSGAPAKPDARIQVAMIQTLRRRGLRPEVDLIIPDEAHHYLADDWRILVDAYPNTRMLCPTATPERRDGRGMGDVCQEIVVAGSMSELIREGVLVPSCVYRPARGLGRDLAEDVESAWLRLSGGASTFVFCWRVEDAKAVARGFRAIGISAADIHEGTPRITREDRLARFRRGQIRVLTNVGTLTEGIDVPEASCIVIATPIRHASLYMQIVGRGLRAANGKRAMILIDLPGVSHRHGMPDEDREFALAGTPIRTHGSHGGPPDMSGEVAAQSVIGEPLVHAGVRVDVTPIEPMRQPRQARSKILVESLTEEAGA